MANIINFTNDKFGSIRTIEIEGKPYFAGKDIAACLGYKNTREAILKYCKGVVKHDTLTKEEYKRFLLFLKAIYID